MITKIHSVLVPLIAGSLVALLTGGLFRCGIFNSLDNRFYDWAVPATGTARRISDDICIVEVDQTSISQATELYGWGWPWPREAYARMVDFLAEGESGPVAFDILFTEKSVYGSDDDLAFAASIKNHGKVIITQMGDLHPLPLFSESAALVADCTSSKDSDGVIRGTDVSRDTVHLSYAPLVVDNGVSVVRTLKQDLPQRRDGSVLLWYKGSIDRYPAYSAIDILQSIDALKTGAEPLFIPEDFTGSYVFFIYYAPGLFDICSTPVGSFYPGSGVAITALDNWICRDFMHQVSDSLVLAVLFFCALFAAWLAHLVSGINSTGRTICCGTLFFVIGPVILVLTGWLLIKTGWYLKIMSLLASYMVSYICVTFYSYIAEGRQKRFIKTAFSQYLSKDVINTLLSDPSQLQLGGEKRSITVFFSDIQGFTTIGEQLAPETVTEVLNIYLTELSDIIMSSGGTIDKYEGDAIIAFWNAPTTVSDHGHKAVTAALECQKKILELTDKLSSFVTQPLYTRIGLNTGEAIVGNMGSKSRFDYTMFGDTVNTGSRLEGLNKQFGTNVLCTLATKEHAENSGTTARFREIGKVLPVGKNLPVTVFEPMTTDRWLSEKAGLDCFAAALQLFYAGDFETALESFSVNAEKHGDVPSSFYAVRCKELLARKKVNPAVFQDWQGIWVASSK